MRSAERHGKAEYQAWRRFKLERLRMWVVTIIVVQSLGCVQLFVTPWTAASQASLSFTISQSLLSFMSVEPMGNVKLVLYTPLEANHKDCFMKVSLKKKVAFQGIWFVRSICFPFQATRMRWMTLEYTNLLLFQMLLVLPGLVF